MKSAQLSENHSVYIERDNMDGDDKVSSIIFLSTYLERNLVLHLTINEAKRALLLKDFIPLHVKDK